MKGLSQNYQKTEKEGDAYDPKAESKPSAIIEWGISQNDEPVRGEKSPLKGGRYYAVAVDFINKEILVEPVAFEVPETATATVIPTAAPAGTATGAEKAGSDDSAPIHQVIWWAVGAIIVVSAVVIIVVVQKKKKS